MNERFVMLIEELEAKYQELLAMPTVTAADVPRCTPIGGVYVFSEGDGHLYVGRTKRAIHGRIREHFGKNPSAASFPWLIAREKTGRKATYRPAGSRDDLLKDDPKFKQEYENAIVRIRKMHVRFVHEPEPLRQTLLEIYVSIATEAKYNSFETH